MYCPESAPIAPHVAPTALSTAPIALHAAPVALHKASIALHAAPTARLNAPTALQAAPTAHLNAPTALQAAKSTAAHMCNVHIAHCRQTMQLALKTPPPHVALHSIAQPIC